MSAVVAIELTSTSAFLVCGESTPQGTILFKSSRLVPITQTQPPSPAINDENTSVDGALNVDLIETPQEEKNKTNIIDELIGEGSLEASFVITPSENILYETHQLPFNDIKKINQVTPSQIQDLVPFDVDNFVFDNIVLRQDEDGSFHILSSLIPTEEVHAILKKLEAVGAEPHFITTKASALLGLSYLFPDQLSGTYALLVSSNTHSSLLLVTDNSLQYLSDIDHPDVSQDKIAAKEVSQLLNCALMRIERDQHTEFPEIYCSGELHALDNIFANIARRPSRLNLASVVENESAIERPLEEVTWALGLIANNGRTFDKQVAPFVDFRKGPFAYRPALENFLAAIREELAFIIIGIVMICVYFGVRLYTEIGELQQVDRAIEKQFIEVLGTPPSEVGSEVISLQTKVADIKEQLSQVGSLSSLSPLHVLKELSTAIGSDLDIEITRINIAQDKIDFEGTVPSNPAVGRLETVLKGMDKIFCSVEVSPLGQKPGRGVGVKGSLKTVCNEL